MIIIHGSLCDFRFFLWAENSETRQEDVSKSRSKVKPQHFPYDLGKEAFKVLFQELGYENMEKGSVFETMIAWIPCVDDIPLPSSPMISDEYILNPEKDRTSIDPWFITALPVLSQNLVELLCMWEDKNVLSHGVVLGKDIRYWTEVLRFAGSLTVRQHFIPSMEFMHDRRYALWKPVISGEDKELFTQLIQAMPGICRAITTEGAKEPATAASVILNEFLTVVVDQLVRIQNGQGVAIRDEKEDEEKTSTVISKRRGRPSSQNSKSFHTSRNSRAFESIHDQWVYRLQSPTLAEMQGDKKELEQFSRQMEDWQRPIMSSILTPFHLCFRLEEPVDEDASSKDDIIGVIFGRRKNRNQKWNVNYLLQSVEDPSLLVPCQEAWKTKSAKASLLKRNNFDPKGYILGALGEAAKVCQEVESSLKSAAPCGYSLDNTKAFRFLSETAWILKQMGFGIFLPSWWTGKGTKVRLNLKAFVESPEMQEASGTLSMDEILKFKWQVALGDQILSLEELEELARMKSPLVHIRGQWVQVSQDEIQEAIQFWKRKEEAIPVRDVVKLALGSGETGETGNHLEFTGVSATGWIDAFLKKLQNQVALQEDTIPEKFSGELRPYQKRGCSWLDFLCQYGFGACLADDMGLGKTVQTLAFLQKKRERGEKLPVLLICPTSVISNWDKESERFTPDLPVMIHHGAEREKGIKFQKSAKRHALVVSSYSLVHRDFETFEKIAWAGIILDEAQNIKNPETKQAKSSRALKAGYRIALTGTPVENNVGELWSIMEFLNHGFLGTESQFKERFFIPIQTARDQDAVSKLKRLTSPFILRRLKTDKNIIRDLPEKIETKVFCPLTKEQVSLYRSVVEDSVSQLEEARGIQRKGIVLSTIMKLKQICNHPAQFLKDNSAIPKRSGKLARVTEMLDEILSVDERILIFTQFAEMGGILQKYLQETFGEEIQFLHGDVPRIKREEMVDRFQNRPNGPHIFILSLKAGGTGLNLMRASHVFHFDRWWNPAVENQATDRAFRIGQKKNVQVHKLVCTGTLEEKIDSMIENKKEIAENVVGTGEGWLTELSTRELKEIFALRQEIMEE